MYVELVLLLIIAKGVLLLVAAMKIPNECAPGYANNVLYVYKHRVVGHIP